MHEMANALLMLYEMTNNSPHKQNQCASGKAQGRKVLNYLLQISKQISQLLWNKWNKYEVPSLPVTRSTVGSWVDPAVDVWVFPAVFNGINSPITDV